MTDFHVPFTTAFRRPFVPRGCQRERVEYPLTEDIAVVRRVSRSDTTVAFRIVYPMRDPKFVELLGFGGKIWWPCGETIVAGLRGFVFVYRSMSAEEWRDRIADQHDLLKIVPSTAVPAARESFSRFELPDGRAEAIAQVRRTLFENYIVCEEAIYATGGIPIHALWRPPHNRSVVAVVGAELDRRVTGPIPLCAYPGFVERPETQRALARGDFWAPGKLIAANLKRSLRAFPDIEVLAPELMPEDLVNQTQIDALFRECMRILDWVLYRTTAPGVVETTFGTGREENHRFKSRVRSAFEEALKPAADDWTTSERRLDALRLLYSGEMSIPQKDIPTMEALKRSFKDLNRRNPKEVLAPEDLDALDSLAP